jgi:hypothetical protein
MFLYYLYLIQSIFGIIFSFLAYKLTQVSRVIFVKQRRLQLLL